MSSARNYPQFFAICRAHGIEKEEIVNQVSEGRTSSLRALTDKEWNQMMYELTANQVLQKAWSPKPGDIQRKKMISIARQMNWNMSTNRPIQDKGHAMIMYRLDTWCLQQKYKKPLMAHTVQELNILVSIFEEKVFKSYLTDLNK